MTSNKTTPKSTTFKGVRVIREAPVRFEWQFHDPRQSPEPHEYAAFPVPAGEPFQKAVPTHPSHQRRSTRPEPKHQGHDVPKAHAQAIHLHRHWDELQLDMPSRPPIPQSQPQAKMQAAL